MATGVKGDPVKEKDIFGFNDLRYADLKLRLVVSESPPPVGSNGLHDNDTSARMIVKKFERGGNVL